MFVFSEMFLPLAVMAASGAGAWLCGERKKLAAGIGTTGLILGILSWGLLLIFNFEKFSSTIGIWAIPILVLGLCGAVHSLAYLKGHGDERSNLYYLFYNITVASMLGVLLVKTPVHFLAFWEFMGLASFALVAFDFKSGKTRDAAWLYLLVCEAGSLFLILMFLAPEQSIMRFVFGLFGFGLKIGFPLLHIWLPQAHPAAPAPVSALMSGAMIPLGFYGLLTFTLNQCTFHQGAGIVLLVLGAVGALGGILFALPKTNIKELLAYSSIENMGIISMGFGLALLKANDPENPIVYFGLAGAMLHIVNHAFLKGGLFLGAGIIQKATHSLEMEEMGGLLKRTPFSGSLFLMNSAGICGLPPFNGFISEFLIYSSALFAICSGELCLMICGVSVLIVLALTGGIAAAAFAKLTGAVYLGEPRSQKAAEAKEQPILMTMPVLILFLLSISVTLMIGWTSRTTIPALFIVAVLSSVFVLLSAVFFWIRFRVLPGRNDEKRGCTWDCGYIAPTARMEYTGSAFVQPITDFCAFLMKPLRKIVLPKGIFAKEASYESETADPGLDRFWNKIFHLFAKLAEKIHILQSGYLHLYILIVTVALIAMLIWGLMLPWSGSILGGVQ
ncbi:MAG: hypothetical protein E7040_12385 [Lentisphaerae bacterium]|nr:hypothetical protein [Lentisphaerota bacterium]